MKLRNWCLIFFVFCVLSAAAQEADWFIGKPIKDLTFKGLNTVSVNELKPVVREYIGKEFSLDIFWEIQGKLLGLEFFEDVEGNAVPGDEAKSSVIIEFTVRERPTISSIKVEGNKKISNSDILDVVGIKSGDFLNEAQIKVDEKSIMGLYREKGFRKIEISSNSELDKEKNTVKVAFVINEGFKTTIKDIGFTGNEFASASTLLGKIKQKKQSLFDSGVFQENLLEEDKANIIKYYKEHGYIDVKIDKVDQIVDDDTDKERSYITLNFYITEGNAYTFGNLFIEGNKIFSEKEISSLVRQKKGAVLNLIKFDEDFQKINMLYSDSGYIFNEITKEEIRDEANKIIDYKIKIVERDKAHIGAIKLKGNTKTRDFVIFRELPFEAGDIFSTEKLRQGYLNLYNLQYFSNIAFTPVQSDVQGLVDLVIDVEEQSSADIKFAVVFSGTEFPISGQIGLADKNFLGNGQNFGVDVEFSNLKQGLSLNFDDNYLFGKGWGGGVSLSFYHTLYQNAYQDILAPIFTDVDVPDPFNSLEEYNALKDTISPSLRMSYDSFDFSLALGTSYFYRTLIGKLGFGTSLAITPRYLTYDDTIYRHYEKATRDNLNNWVFIDTWSNTLSLDDRDIYYNPENGYLIKQDIKMAGGFLFGSRDYIKLVSTLEGFLTLLDVPVFEEWNYQAVLAAHAAASFILPNFVNNKFNASELDKLYISANDNTARGCGTITNGEAMLDFSLELRSPIFKQYIWTTLFADAASLCQDSSNISFNDFYFSFGVGLRLTIPGLPLRFYLAQGYKITDGAWSQLPGDFSLGGLTPKFVLAITPPGGF